MNATLLQKLEALGYYTLPPRHEHCIGHTGLLVLMRSRPLINDVSFDPQSIHLRLLDWDGKAHWTIFKATTPFPMSRVICPGFVTVCDQNGKKAVFFSFGGSLEAQDEAPGEKVYALRSSAPVLELTDDKVTVADQMVYEVEALWAKLKAVWGLSDERFWRYLTRIHPFQLYVTSVQAVLDCYHSISILDISEAQQALYYRLRHEKAWLQAAEQWPPVDLALAELPH